MSRPQRNENRPAITPVFRFAPSPNGELHLGHALSALLNFEAAQANGGRFLLRIEDIDRERCRPEYEARIYEDLAWLGVSWEEPVRRQSEHFGDYAAALGRLRAMGLIYPSFASRAAVKAAVAAREALAPWPRDPDGAPLYPGLDRDLAPDRAAARMAGSAQFAWRLDMAKAGRPVSWTETGEGPDGETGATTADPAIWGDFIVARADTPTSYHLAVVVDDARQGVTHVVRGQDLFRATAVHRLLQDLLGLPAPLYRHHRLIRDANGNKLAKSSQSTSLRTLREGGATPADIRALIGLDPAAGNG